MFYDAAGIGVGWASDSLKPLRRKDVVVRYLDWSYRRHRREFHTSGTAPQIAWDFEIPR